MSDPLTLDEFCQPHDSLRQMNAERVWRWWRTGETELIARALDLSVCNEREIAQKFGLTFWTRLMDAVLDPPNGAPYSAHDMNMLSSFLSPLEMIMDRLGFLEVAERIELKHLWVMAGFGVDARWREALDHRLAYLTRDGRVIDPDQMISAGHYFERRDWNVLTEERLKDSWVHYFSRHHTRINHRANWSGRWDIGQAFFWVCAWRADILTDDRLRFFLIDQMRASHQNVLDVVGALSSIENDDAKLAKAIASDLFERLVGDELQAVPDDWYRMYQNNTFCEAVGRLPQEISEDVFRDLDPVRFFHLFCHFYREPTTSMGAVAKGHERLGGWLLSLDQKQAQSLLDELIFSKELKPDALDFMLRHLIEGRAGELNFENAPEDILRHRVVVKELIGRAIVHETDRAQQARARKL